MADRGTYLDAANEYRAAQLAIANRPEAHANLGTFEARAGNLDAAVAHYQRSLQMEPRSVVARINAVDVLRMQGDEVRAEELLRDGLRQTPDNAALRHSLGLLLVRTDRAEDGVAELGKAAQLAPDLNRYVYVLGIALNSFGRSDEAVQVFRDARERFDTDFDIAWALATILRDRGEYQEAVAIAAELVYRYPGNQDVAALLQSMRPQ